MINKFNDNESIGEKGMTMIKTVKERLLKEIEDFFPMLLEELLDFILFIKQRHQLLLTQSKQGEVKQPFKSKIKAFDGLFDQVSPVCF